jgi:PEP-CTERM motif-containing protein
MFWEGFVMKIRTNIKSMASVAVVAAMTSMSASAAVIDWTDWVAADASSASGTIGSVGISFSGNNSPSAILSGGTNYWAHTPSSYMDGVIVDNGPGTSDMIRLDLGTAAGVRTITFSEAVLNPIMAVHSVGRANLPVAYDFDTPFDVVAFGPGFWGGPGTLTESAGDVLTGWEGNGVIQFQGLVTSISWTNNPSEYWHGFTLGLSQETVPEPAILGFLGLGLGAIGLFGRSRKRKESKLTL